jgi:hypothetical protein
MTPTVERECHVFTGYLLGSPPPPYVVRKYVEAHDLSPAFSRGSRFDIYILRIAATRPSLTRPADSYARIFAANGLLRRKLVLLLAILETAPSCSVVDAVEGSRPALLLRLVGAGLRSVFSVTAGIIVFLPAHVLLARRESTTA